jgi:uncharacterized protein YecE (DUF72 family)
MGNVDIEIYVSQLISFFENNPNDLMELIGDVQKEEFYQKLREKCIENHNKGEDIVLTKNQIVNIVVELKVPELFTHTNPKEIVEGYIQKTKWGDIILN